MHHGNEDHSEWQITRIKAVRTGETLWQTVLEIVQGRVIRFFWFGLRPSGTCKSECRLILGVNGMQVTVASAVPDSVG